jgi:hypothetical protein
VKQRCAIFGLDDPKRFENVTTEQPMPEEELLRMVQEIRRQQWLNPSAASEESQTAGLAVY